MERNYEGQESNGEWTKKDLIMNWADTGGRIGSNQN